jgi:hypothetical protein
VCVAFSFDARANFSSAERITRVVGRPTANDDVTRFTRDLRFHMRSPVQVKACGVRIHRRQKYDDGRNDVSPEVSPHPIRPIS